MMKIEYNVTGEDRKRLVTAISGILGIKARYTGVPKCSYVIGFVAVTREGTMEVEDSVETEKVRSLADSLAEMGFKARNADQLFQEEEPVERDPVEEGAVEPDNREAEADAGHENAREETGTTISVPRGIFTDNALDNLRKIVKVKGPLLRKALMIDNAEIEVTDEAVSFPWFGELTPEDLKVFSQFIEKLCKFAIVSKRITSKERRTDNERFAMRTWLIRLGCIGDEYKGLRKKLLAPLSGDAAWRFGRPEKQTAE